MGLATTRLYQGHGGSFRQALLAQAGIVACWPLSEISSINRIRNIVDTAEYVGTIFGSDVNTGYPVNIPEGALGLRSFGASDGYVVVPHDDALCLAGGAMDITFLIVTSTNDATNRAIVCKQDTGPTGNGWHVSMQNGAIEFYLKVGGVAIFNFQRGSIADGSAHLVRCCYDPTGTATARIMIDGVQSGATVTAVSTLPGATTAGLEIGQFTDGTGRFIGTRAYLAIGTSGDHTVAATLQATLVWTDVTSHTRQVDGIELRYGIDGTDPTALVAGPGTLQYTHKNRNPSTKVLGYYSIGHANACPGFDLGIPVMLAITYNSTTYFKFRGRLQKVTPETGQYRSRSTQLIATDWMQVLTETHLSGVEAQIDQDAWQCLGFVADNADNPPCSTQIDTDTGSFPFCFDNSQVESMSGMTEAQRIAQSDLLHVYVKGDTTTGGVLVLQSRQSRQEQIVAATFDDDDLFELSVVHDVESMVNRCKITVQPRSDGTADQVLYALGETRLITAKENIVIEGAYTDPAQSGKRCGAQNLQALASGTDYAMFRNSNGTGRDMTSSLQITDESGANGARFLIHNADDADGYLTILRKRGQALLDYDPTTAVYEDGGSLRAYGARQVSFDMPYQTDSAVAQNAALLIVNARKSPLSTVREMRFLADSDSALMEQALLREPGDLIKVKEQVATGSVYVQYYIQAVRLEIEVGGTIWCSWMLEPVNAQGGFWILGTSILGTDTVLGWTD